jgi:hypothetical protein
MNRWLVRSTRRAEPVRPGAASANRSITDGWNTTSGTSSRPSDAAKSASRAADHSSAFALLRPGGPARSTTTLASAAAGAGTETGRQAAM